MRFTVTWRQSAQDELINLWLKSDSARRETITSATNSIDRTLLKDADQQGEAAEDGRRALWVDPLVVLFEVSELDRLACIVGVWIA